MSTANQSLANVVKSFLPWKRPAPVMTRVPLTLPEMVIVQYFDSEKTPREKVLPLVEYTELLQYAATLNGNMSLSLNSYIENL